MLRMSTGDHDFAMIAALSVYEAHMYWVIWLLITLVFFIIFMNFIIADVSESYARVMESVDGFILQERAALVNSAEQMMGSCIKKNKLLFPKYIIIRETDS